MVMFSKQDVTAPDAKKARHEDPPTAVDDASTSAGPAPSGGAEGGAAPSSQHDMSPEPEETPAEEAEDAGGNGEDQPGGDEDRSQDEGESTLLPDSPVSDKENIKQKFLVDMPKDFYSFLKFCKSLDKDAPQG